jgi:hypothetical protein
MSDDKCPFDNDLDLFHKWAHYCGRAMSKEQRETASKIGENLIEMINEQEVIDAVKFMALWAVLLVGAKQLEENLGEAEMCYQPGNRAVN